jgi:hypothetical protein
MFHWPLKQISDENPKGKNSYSKIDSCHFEDVTPLLNPFPPLLSVRWGEAYLSMNSAGMHVALWLQLRLHRDPLGWCQWKCLHNFNSITRGVRALEKFAAAARLFLALVARQASSRPDRIKKAERDHGPTERKCFECACGVHSTRTMTDFLAEISSQTARWFG